MSKKKEIIKWLIFSFILLGLSILIIKILKEGDIYLLGVKVQGDRFDQNKKQYFLTNLRKVNFKE